MATTKSARGSKEPAGQQPSPVPHDPELRQRVIEEGLAFGRTDKGASGRTAQLFAVRETLLAENPGLYADTDELRDAMTGGTCPQHIMDRFHELMGTQQ